MKTHKWIIAIMIASVVWIGCDDDDDNPIDKPELNDTDEAFVEFAARSNMTEIEFGELAITKATDSLVKAFAQQMIDEHTTAQNELNDIADDFDDIDWPNGLDNEGDSIMTELNNASGHSFDTLYMMTQQVLHERTAGNFRTATTNTTDARVKAYANKYLPKIEMHLTRADSIHTAITTPDNGTEDTDGGTIDGGTTDSGTTDGGTTDGGTTDGGTTDGGTTDGGTTDGGTTDGGTTDGGTTDGGTTDGGTTDGGTTDGGTTDGGIPG